LSKSPQLSLPKSYMGGIGELRASGAHTDVYWRLWQIGHMPLRHELSERNRRAIAVSSEHQWDLDVLSSVVH
jgi:hypothetical protein